VAAAARREAAREAVELTRLEAHLWVPCKKLRGRGGQRRWCTGVNLTFGIPQRPS
jgi:hypothetical protein